MTERARVISHPSSNGSALVIMLIMVAIVMVLVLAVLDTGSASTKRSEATMIGRDADALERLPAQIIITQLQRATTQSVTPGGERLNWASQPGMIRVFGSQIPKGKDRPAARMHYRLYSSPMMNSPALDVQAEAAALNQWAAQSAAFTDLNQPVVSHRSGKQETLYPIASAAALGQVEGFMLRSAAPGQSAANPLPMPVAWIYMLRDGQLVMPSNVNGARASFSPAVVTKENPIIGRIAFWTDDESCKLNLNTASEAIAWDMPSANTRTERGYGDHVPTPLESYRNSGHPAFTSLSPVLKTFGGAIFKDPQWPKPDLADPQTKNNTAWKDYVDCYQSLVPHGLTAELKIRQDRHFANVDEFWFDPQRQRNGSGNGFLMQQEDLNKARFFLTTHSASPELNPFGQPKISLWMVPQKASDRSSIDRQVTQCTALNTNTDQRYEFAFQRASNWTSAASQGSSQSMTDDWSLVPRNREMYAWLQRLCGQPLPGYGGCFNDKYGAHSRDQILTSMLDMLRWSVNTTSYLPPSLGSSNPQGLAEQSAVPLVPVMDAKAEPGTTRGFGRFPVITEVALVFAFTDVERNANGLPRDDDNDGICDRATKLRAFIVINPYVVSSGAPAVSPAWSVRIRALQHLSIGPGIGLLLPGGNVRNRCSLSGTQLLNAGAAWGGNISPYACFASQFIQINGEPKLIGERSDPNRDFPFISSNDVSLPNDLGKPGTTMKFKGGSVIVDVMAADAPVGPPPQANDAIHSVQMLFPEKQEGTGADMEIPMPSLLVSDFTNGPRKVDERFKPVMMAGELRLPIIQRGDIVRSMILNPDGLTHGDVRLLAAKREWLFPSDGTDTKVFVKHPDYAPPGVPIADTKPLAQSLRDGAYMTTAQYGGLATSSTAGSLLPNVKFVGNAVPALPLGLFGALQQPSGSDSGGRLGDWETGLGVYEDGPFVSRCRLMPGAYFSRQSLTNAKLVPDTEPLSQMSSAISFGAIPSGAFGDAKDDTPRPWQTLLFCPNPAGRTTPSSQQGRYDGVTHDHFGFASPPDHLWLEFFTMPVTAPWPMTSNFATEGKVNLNHQFMPFTWMQRATALHGALKGVRLTAIPTAAMIAAAGSAKGHDDGIALDATFRYEVDADKTVQGINQRLDAGDVFRSPSEICEQFLFPKRIEGHTYDGADFTPPDPAKYKIGELTDWWNGEADNPADAFEATGDNLREEPYAQLYPRLCTQSNVYRVHYRVQVLHKSRATTPDVWDDDHDHIASERRGNCVIERRFTPSATALPDPATSDTAASLHEQQTFRIVSQSPFGS